MRLSDFDYELPPELIAQYPPADRSGSRLLHLDGASGVFSDHRIVDLPQFFRQGDLLVFNDTRVIKARLTGVKDSGGQVEVMIDRVLDNRRALALVRASRAPRVGQHVLVGGNTRLTVVARDGDLFELTFPDDVFSVLDRCGQVPLPPYIDRSPRAEDEARYQTVYARTPGAVAAPTAGLHFDQDLLGRLRDLGVATAYVTLHVGAGTFQPVRTDHVERHVMHAEWYSVPPATADAIAHTRAHRGRICAVGTTSLRALESAASDGSAHAGSGETRLFVRPGYRFRVVDRLLTNFHLPRSTLLMLVSAFAGLDNIRRAYRHAIAQRYRFFSYGDAMLLERAGVGHESGGSAA